MEFKKQMIPTIVGIVFLLVLAIGATYAYYTFTSTISSGTNKITSTLSEVGNVSLTSNTPSTLSMAVSTSNMMDVGSNVTYYGTLGNNQPATTVETTPVIATASVVGEGTFSCSYTLTITATSTGTSTYTAFQGMTGKSTNQIVLTINTEKTTTLDFNTSSLFTNRTITGTLSNISASNPVNITAQLKLVNKTGLNQTALAGTDINIAITPTTFTCTITG